MYSCLYLNKPVRTGDMTFQPEWWKYYDKPPLDLVHYISIDPAPPPGEKAGDTDYNVVLTCGKSLGTGDVYLIDYFRQRCNPGELIEEYVRQCRQYHPVRATVETVAYQKSLMYWIKERMKGEGLYVVLEPLTHGRKSKATRIMGLQPLVKTGKFKIQTHHTAFLAEATAFPYGKHDDLLDAAAMQLPLWALTRSQQQAAVSKEFDPHTFEGAVELLKYERRQSNRKNLIMQPLLSRKDYQLALS